MQVWIGVSDFVVQLLIDGKLINWRALPYKRTGAKVGYSQGTVLMYAHARCNIELRWDVNRLDTQRVLPENSVFGTLEWRSAYLCGAKAMEEQIPQNCTFSTIPQRFLVPSPCGQGETRRLYDGALNVRLECVCPDWMLAANYNRAHDPHCAGLWPEERFGNDSSTPNIYFDDAVRDVYGGDAVWEESDGSEGVCSNCQ